MPRVFLSNSANEDIVDILKWSQKHFGEVARLRYEALLTQAIVDIVASPDRLGSVARDDITVGARTYHLWHSRNRVQKARGVVGKPRHFLLFRIKADGDIEIGRVLHDSMDLGSNLPPDYSADSSGRETPE